MVFKDYYRILGLETNKISKDEIKNAYRLLAKKYHPDMNITNPKAEERFKDINEAYQVLTDDSAKRKYDRIWTKHRAPKNEEKRDSLFDEFFTMFFGGVSRSKAKQIKKNRKEPIKGENIETEISATLEEVFNGTEKKIGLRTVNGKMKIFAVKVPAGIRNNEKIRLSEQGKPGKNGGKNGDLFIKIKIENHEKFKLEGSDIYTELKIAPWEAALGQRITIPSLDGNVVVSVPAGVCSGEEIKIPEKGYMTGFGTRGNFVVQVQIMVPKELSKEEQKLYTKLKDISKFAPRETSL